MPCNVFRHLGQRAAAAGPKGDEEAPAARPGRSARRPAGSLTVKSIFIGDASDDKKLAAVLVLLQLALNMKADEIPCTSVDGHRLPGRSDTDETLRDTVLAAKTLVGIVSPTSRKSTYVQMELGARWATRKHKPG